MLTGTIDRDLGALWGLLDALILASSGLSSLFARFELLRAPFLLAFEPLRSRSQLPTGLRSLKNRWFSRRLTMFHENLGFLF